MNQTKNYLVTKSVSLIVADYFVVMIVLRGQVATQHYLVAVGLAVDYLQLGWLCSHSQCFERQPQPLAVNRE